MLTLRSDVCSARSVSRARTGTRRPSHSTRLPAELIFNVLTLALTPSQGASAEAASIERASLLATFSLVCKATHKWAQHKLYSHPVLKQGDIDPFTRAVKKNPALAAKVTTITAVGTGACTPASSDADEEDDEGVEGGGEARSMRHLGRLKKLLALCPGLVHLRLCGVISRSLTDLDGGRQLQSLTLKDCLIIDVTTTSRYHPDFLHFPHIKHLNLLRTSLDATTTALFLSPGSFPNLKSLAISNCNLVEDAHSRMRLGPLEPKSLIATVSQLALDGLSPEEATALEWDRMDRVEELSVPMALLDSIDFGHLPKLTHLRLVDHLSARAAISPRGRTPVQTHLQTARSLLGLLDPDFPLESIGKRLEHVTLPVEWRDRVECREPGQMKRTLEKLGRACRKEGVKIRFDERKTRRVEWKLAGREIGDFWEPERCSW